MLTVHELVAELDLRLLCGETAASTPIRWVHVSEHPDPTPWLSGGELLLTTGMGLTDAESQREYVRRLTEHNLAGLGFGTGFGYERIPEALLNEARAHDFALFEVPYAMPFIAITERAADHLVNEQFEILQRAVEIQRRVESLIVQEHALADVVRALSEAIGATLLVIEATGEVIASHAFEFDPSPAVLDAICAQVATQAEVGVPVPFTPVHDDLCKHATALPLPDGGRDHRGIQWLVAIGDGGGLPDLEAFIAQHAVMAVSLALMRERIVHATERRLAGDVLTGALNGSLSAAELGARLAPFGIRGDCMVLVIAAGEIEGAEVRLERALRAKGLQGLVATVPTARRRVLCAVLDPGELEPLELAADLRAATALGVDSIGAAISHTAPREALRRSFHEARCALEVGAHGKGDRTRVASAADLGAYRLLLSLQDDEGLRIYCDELLGPIERSRSGNGEDLLRSLEVYLEHNGSWEAAARALFCHRHTLRYRIARIEELTGRQLDLAAHRMEFWLALRGRELLG